MNYDQNMCFCGRRAKQKVLITLGVWDYRKFIEIDVSTNMLGFDVLDCAIENAYDSLDFVVGYEHEFARVILVRPAEDGEGEDTLECDDDEEQGIEWFRQMVIGLQIVSIQEDGSIWQ